MTNLLILHLVIYNEDKDENYSKMKKYSEVHYNRFININTRYVRFSEDILEDYILENNILLIKGKETWVPGILDKTVKAIQYFSNINYDYIIRSNISSILNLELIYNKLLDNKITYGGCCIQELTQEDLVFYDNLIDQSKNILKYSLLDGSQTVFAQGTCIILSKEAYKFLLNNLDSLQYSIVDDVSIGIFFKYILNVIPYNLNSTMLTYNTTYKDLLSRINTTCVFRSKSLDRLYDTHLVGVISKMLIGSNIIKSTIYADANDHSKNIDILEEFKKHFVKLNHILIPKNTNFNAYFGDPFKNTPKELIITTYNNNIYTLKEKDGLCLEIN